MKIVPHQVRHFFSGHSLHEVFTPNDMAVATYIKREELEQELAGGLKIPGLQLVVCGPAGSGKSNLVQWTLRQAKKKSIVSYCTETTTVHKLIANAFVQLPAKHGSLLFCQTPQRLGEILGASGTVWVLEDFHRMAEPERQKMLEVIKIFSDLSGVHKNPKLIVVGTGIAALELFYYNADMSNRIVEVNPTYLDKPEIAGIIRKSGQLLNISFSPKLRRALIRYANAMPGILHELGFLLCMSKGIWKKRSKTVHLNERDLIDLVDTYLSMHKGPAQMITRALELPVNANMYRLLELLAKTSQNGLTTDRILHHREFIKTAPAQLQYSLHALDHRPQLLRQSPYSDAWAFADPYIKAYAIMYFESKTFPALVPH